MTSNSPLARFHRSRTGGTRHTTPASGHATPTRRSSPNADRTASRSPPVNSATESTVAPDPNAAAACPAATASRLTSRIAANDPRPLNRSASATGPSGTGAMRTSGRSRNTSASQLRPVHPTEVSRKRTGAHTGILPGTLAVSEAVARISRTLSVPCAGEFPVWSRESETQLLLHGLEANGAGSRPGQGWPVCVASRDSI